MFDNNALFTFSVHCCFCIMSNMFRHWRVSRAHSSACSSTVMENEELGALPALVASVSDKAVQPRRIVPSMLQRRHTLPPFALGAGATPRITCIELARAPLRFEHGDTNSPAYQQSASGRAFKRQKGAKGPSETPDLQGEARMKTSTLGAGSDRATMYMPGICKAAV